MSLPGLPDENLPLLQYIYGHETIPSFFFSAGLSSFLAGFPKRRVCF
jgi:hypothetical protein